MFQTTNQESMGVFILDDLLLFHYHRSSFVTLTLAIQPGNGKTLLIDFFPLKDLIIFAPILNLKFWYLVKFVSMFNDTNVLARIKEFVEQGQENDLGYWRYKTAKCHHTQPSKGPFLENHSRPQERMSQSGDGLSQRSLSK